MIGSHPIASTPIAAGLAQQQAAGTGTVARTLAAATLTSTGKVYIVASLAKTLANATSLSSADLYIDADLSRTLASATLVSAGSIGTIPITGTLSRTLDAATVIATGTGPRTGTVARTLAGVTLASAAIMAQPISPVDRRGDGARPGRAFREAAHRALQGFLEEEVRKALHRFKGKRSKPRISSEMLTAAAEAILNAPDIPEWEFKRVNQVIRDILGSGVVRMDATPMETGQALLELAVDVGIEEDDEEVIAAILQAEVEEMMSL